WSSGGGRSSATSSTGASPTGSATSPAATTRPPATGRPSTRPRGCRTSASSTPRTPSRCRRSSPPPPTSPGCGRSTTSPGCRPGAGAASACWVTPPTPPAPTPGRAPASPWRTRSCWPPACGTCPSRPPRELHAAYPEPVPALLAAATDVAGVWPVYDVAGLPTWRRGRIGLLGDAAHATSPNAGQGASLALEDAVVLAACLRDVPDPAAA